MPSSPPPPLPPAAGERLDTLLTFGPAILVAFVLDWVLTTQSGWSPRRALIASVATGIVLALLLQHAIARRRRR